MSNESNYNEIKMAALLNVKINTSISNTAIQRTATDTVQQLGYKEEQLKVVAEVIRGHDVFEVFLTGFSGKNLCFTWLPLYLFHELASLLSSPLTATKCVCDFSPVHRILSNHFLLIIITTAFQRNN